MKSIILLLLACICSSVQAEEKDSVSSLRCADIMEIKPMNKFQRKMDKIAASRVYQMTYIGVPLVVGGLIVKSEDDHFRSLRNDYLPTFRKHYDDYLQYAPIVAMLGLKIGGVEGRSSWPRMLTSDAFSAIIMAAVVNSLKASTKVMRPDGSNRHSFPSGHTATAFMAATMMHKEYGGRSPWYSLGAYSVATATGLSRQMNNKHWLSDVMVGAGIGILSTELGYFLADLIFKDKGITNYSCSSNFNRMRRPSFLGVYLGFNKFPGNIELQNHSALRLSTGSNAGFEGAHFFNSYIGIGGRFTVANMAAKLDNKAQDESLDMGSSNAGVYFSYPISARWLTGSKLLVGYNYFSKTWLNGISVGGKGGVNFGTGASMTFLAKQNLGIRFFVDYNIMNSFVPKSHKYMQMVTLGSSAAVTF